MDKPGLEALLTSLDHWAGLFILLVVIGVGGELVVHLLSSRASGRLIALQNAEEQKLKTEMSRLGGVTAEANKVAAQANERANEMEVQTEELRRQNLEIQRRINPRFLTTAEQQTIFEAIHPFHGQPPHRENVPSVPGFPGIQRVCIGNDADVRERLEEGPSSAPLTFTISCGYEGV